MEHTKGELKIGSRDPQGRLVVSAYSDDNDFPCIPVVIMEHGVVPTKEQAEANAKELVHRWNAFEKDGLVDELREALEGLINYHYHNDMGVKPKEYHRAIAAIAKVKA